MKSVTVTNLAFFAGVLRSPGDILEVEDSFSASWADEVPKKETEPTAEPKRRGRKPNAMKEQEAGGD